jgi:hypothetical protein
MIDRTAEDELQDQRIAHLHLNLETLEKELKKLLDGREARLARLEEVVRPLAELEQRISWLGSQIDNCRKALAPILNLSGAFELLHTRVNVIEDHVFRKD